MFKCFRKKVSNDILNNQSVGECCVCKHAFLKRRLTTIPTNVSIYAPHGIGSSYVTYEYYCDNCRPKYDEVDTKYLNSGDDEQEVVHEYYRRGKFKCDINGTIIECEKEETEK